MSFEYKFFDEKRKLYKNFILIDPNKDRNEEIEIINQPEPDIIIDQSIMMQCIELFQANESPKSILEQVYPVKYPKFDHFFLEKFSEFYQRNGPDCDFLLSKIVFSFKENAYQLAPLNILNSLFLKVPYSFKVILKIMESNSIFINHFVNSHGIFVLSYFSNIPEIQLDISQIFLCISQRSQFDFAQELKPPIDFYNYDHKIDVSFKYFFNNLLSSQIPDVQLNCLESIDIIFNNPRNALQSLPSLLLNLFDTLLQNCPILIPKVIDVAYNFDICWLTRPLLDACHFIFQKNIEVGLKPALFFISKEKNMHFICDYEDTSEFIFTDLTYYCENGTFEISTLATYELLLFMTLCNPLFYERSIKLGLFQFISNTLFSINPTIFDQENFSFLIIKLSCFFERLTASFNIDLSNQNENLMELMESLQPFTTYPDDKISPLASSCISIIQKYLDDGNLE